MAFAPIALTIPQYEDYPNNWLKAYEQGTVTPLAMATDATGGTAAAKFELDAQGFPITAGNARLIPFIDGDYDLWLFPNEGEADGNITVNAIQLADNLNTNPFVTSGGVAVFATVALMKLESLTVGQNIETQGYYASGDGGNARYLVVSPQAFDGYGDHESANGNIVVLQVDGSTGMRMYGASPSSSSTINTAAIAASYKAAGIIADSIGGTYSIKELTLDVSLTATDLGILFICAGSRRTILQHDGSAVINGIVTVLDSTNNFTFSIKMQGLQIDANASAENCLYVVGTQENCVFDDLVLTGSQIAPLKIISYGNHSGGSDADTPAHLSQFSNIHLITDVTTHTNGIELVGVQDCEFRNITTTVPPASATLGTTGINIGAECQNNNFNNTHTESFAAPIVIAAGSRGNKFDEVSFSSSVTLAGTETAIAAAAGTTPLLIENIRFTGTAYNTVFNSADTNSDASTIVGSGDLQQNRYGRAEVTVDDNNGAAVTRNTFLGDHYVQENRLIRHINVSYQPVKELTADSTTPAVDDRNVFNTANTVATSISTFSNGVNGQLITVVVKDANTTFLDGAGIFLRDGVDYLAIDGDTIDFIRHANAWYERSRSVVVTSTTAFLASITNNINTTSGKKAGFMVFNTTSGRPQWAAGSADGDVWVDAFGATNVTPV